MLDLQSEGVAVSLARGLVSVLLETLGTDISNDKWGRIWAQSIGAETVPEESGFGVVKNEIAWETLVFKVPVPYSVNHVYLSYHMPLITRNDDAARMGGQILKFWNSRIESGLKRYSELRTAVLLRGENLRECVVMDFPVQRYALTDYEWEFDEDGSVEGYEIGTDIHRFTWQPHGSQFTYIPPTPVNRLKVRVRRPPRIDPDFVLGKIKFDPSWVEIVK